MRRRRTAFAGISLHVTPGEVHSSGYYYVSFDDYTVWEFESDTGIDVVQQAEEAAKRVESGEPEPAVKAALLAIYQRMAEGGIATHVS